VAAELEARWNRALLRIAEVEAKIAEHDAARTSGLERSLPSLAALAPCLRQLGKKQVHRAGIETRHHQRDAGVACRAYRADNPSRLVANIAQRGVWPRCHQT
jgi:hypothetical protein